MDDVDLAETFALYGNSQSLLKKLLVEVQDAYNDLDKVVEDLRKKTEEGEDQATSLDIRPLLLSDRDEKGIKQTFQDPRIVFVGQTNAGKSSLINEILGATVVKAEDVPCTSRIMELEYGPNDKPTVRVVAADGKQISEETMKRAYIPSGLVNLPEDKRDDPKLLGSKVFVKINNPFLKSGVKIVDSPGKNEFQQLDALVEEHMESVLPLIVYVIDGRNMLSKQDIVDIKSLKHNVPDGNIFFVVTKCDNPEYMENSAVDSDEEDGDKKVEDPNRLRPTKLEKDIREGIYRKLIQHDFLPNVPIDQCNYYHTLSSRYVKKYRWALDRAQTDDTKKILRECQRFKDDFQSFKLRLLRFITKALIGTMTGATSILQVSLVKCLDYFMDTSNVIFNDKQENEKNMKLIEVEEFVLSQLLQQLIRNSKAEFRAAVEEVVKYKRQEIIDVSAEFKFVKYHVPTDGFIASKAVDQYKDELRDKILTRIGEIIHNEVMTKCSKLDEIFADVSEKVRAVQDKVGNKIQIHDALRQMFISEYKFDIKRAKLTKSIFQNIVNALKNFVSLLSLKPIIQLIKGIDVTERKWKEGVAIEVLDVINPGNVADVIIKGICDHMTEGHNAFSEQLKALKNLYDESNRLGENDRKLIRRKAPQMARLLLMAWNITDRMRFGKINYGKVRGKGAQGVVQDCDAVGPNGEKCVAKLIKMEKEDELGDMGLEIHFSRKLQHKNVAAVFGTIYECVGRTVYELSIIMPRLECDLLQALPQIEGLKARLIVAMEVADAVQYIHSQGMMHRDIKCANILLDSKLHVKITDFGLCKPPGISDISFVGTPIHMAPEIILQREYSEKVDVYAFGILLWYICEGQGNHPKYVFQHNAIQGLLLETAVGRRPERVVGMREDCWELMEKCWQGEPILRPSMPEVIDDMRAIIMQL